MPDQVCQEVSRGCAAQQRTACRLSGMWGGDSTGVWSEQGAGMGKEDTCVACRIETCGLESVKVRPTRTSPGVMESISEE